MATRSKVVLLNLWTECYKIALGLGMPPPTADMQARAGVNFYIKLDEELSVPVVPPIALAKDVPMATEEELAEVLLTKKEEDSAPESNQPF